MGNVSLGYARTETQFTEGTNSSESTQDTDTFGVGYNLGGGVSIEVASAGSAIMVWTDDKNLDDTDLDIYGQRIDSNCNTLWTTPEEGGIPICTIPSVQQYAKVTYYNETHSVVVWEDRRNDPNAGDVYAQFVSMDGVIYDDNSIEVCVDDYIQILAPYIR